MSETNDDPGTTRDKDPLDVAAEETLKLLDSLQRRLGREFGKGVVRGGMSGLGQTFGGGRPAGDVWSEAVATPADDEEYICRACPVCRAKAARRDAARRGGGEDVTDHLVAAGNELFAAFKQAVDAVSRPQRPQPPRRAPEAGRGDDPDRADLN